jgi:hypothetical protein
MLFQDARESPYFQNRDRNFPAVRRRLCFSSCSRTCLPATPGWRRIASSRSERLQAAKATRIWTDLGRAGERAGNCWMRRSTWKRSLSLGAWRWRTVHSVFRLRFSSKLSLFFLHFSPLDHPSPVAFLGSLPCVNAPTQTYLVIDAVSSDKEGRGTFV